MGPPVDNGFRIHDDAWGSRMGMFDWFSRRARPERAILGGLSRCQAVVEFGPDGVIRSANERFLAALGCRADAVLGMPHARFIQNDDEERLWRGVGRGEPMTGTFRAIGPGGQVAWLHGSYLPLSDGDSRVSSVMMYAVDVTSEHLRSLDLAQRLADAGRGQAVVEFSLDGMLLAANDAFLELMGYRSDELLGRHHSMFVDEAESRSDAYIAFWRRLRSGLHDAALYRRLGRNGRVVWLQATYNPVFDAHGRPVKIVKYAIAIDADAAHRPAPDLQDVMELGDHPDTLSMDAAIEAALAARHLQGGTPVAGGSE